LPDIAVMINAAVIGLGHRPVDGRGSFLISVQILDLIGAFEAIIISLETRAPALLKRMTL
jgi:hypothetical protein